MTSISEFRESREFAREVKFFVPPSRANEIREFARARLEADPHAGGPTGDIYQVTSLYFDTAEFDVFRRKGSFGRAKYRIRRYGSSEGVFLERKLRTRRVVTKRRSAVAIQELRRLDNNQPDEDWAGYWFHRRLLVRGLKPVCQISYTRTARVGFSASGVNRLTLDEDLRALPIGGYRFNDALERAPMTNGLIIVEMKFRRDMPVAFKEIVEKFRLNSERISKYRLAVAALGYGEANPSSDEELEATVA